MVHFASLSALVLTSLAVLPTGYAGPACARRNQGTASCLARCADKWGWPGRVMGEDRWGQVMTRTVTDMGTVLTKACRVRPTSSVVSSSAVPSTAVPVAVQNVGNQVSSELATSSSSSFVVASTTLEKTVVAPSLSIPSSSTVTSVETSSSEPSSSEIVSSTTSRFFVHLSSSPQASISPSSDKASVPSLVTSASTESPVLTITRSSQTSTLVAPPSSSPSPLVIVSEAVTRKSASSKAPAPTPQAPAPASSSSRAPTPQPKATSQTSQTFSGDTSQSDIDQYLTAHNTVRAQHGAVPLTWSDELASKAQQWANGCVFKHSGGSLGPFGENLAAGTGSSYNIAAAVKSWTDEVSQYDPSNPQPSHFTQVVWKATTQVGCAVQECNGIFDPSFGLAKFFVCEYSPPGNVIGEFAQNVQA